MRYFQHHLVPAGIPGPRKLKSGVAPLPTALCLESCQHHVSCTPHVDPASAVPHSIGWHVLRWSSRDDLTILRFPPYISFQSCLESASSSSLVCRLLFRIPTLERGRNFGTR